MARPSGSPFAPAPDPWTGAILAGWRARAFAYLLDFGIVMTLLAGICIGTGVALSRTIHRADGTQLTGVSGWGAAVIIVEVLVISTAYFAIFNGIRGATPGMRSFKIGVRDAHGLALIGPWRAGARFGLLYVALLLPVPGAGFVVIALDLLSPLWDRRRQAWHDKVARSIVVSLAGLPNARPWVPEP